ncbi:2-dehydropantoate 2-reductase [Glycomyces albus]
MTICIYGAGAIGCYIGGRLAATGTDVVFVGRERIASQIEGNGLTVTDWRGSELRVERPRFETAPEVAAEADVVLVTVKSAATAEAARELAPLLRPGTVVVSFQNGLHNTEVLREHLPEATVLAGMVGFNVVGRGRGRFHCAVSGAFEAQQHEALAALAPDFERAGLRLALHADLTGAQAAKLLLNLNNAVNALSGLPLKAELGQRDYRRCWALAQREGLAAFAAARVVPAKILPLPPRWMPVLLGTPDAVFTRAAARMLAIDPLARTSMAEDLNDGRPTEVDYLNGEITALAERHGTAAPANSRLVELVHDAEHGGRREWSGEDLLAELTER